MQLVGFGLGVQVNPAGLDVTVPVPLFDPDASVTVRAAVGVGGGVVVPPPSLPPPHAASNIAAPIINTEVIFPDFIISPSEFSRPVRNVFA